MGAKLILFWIFQLSKACFLDLQYTNQKPNPLKTKHRLQELTTDFKIPVTLVTGFPSCSTIYSSKFVLVYAHVHVCHRTSQNDLCTTQLQSPKSSKKSLLGKRAEIKYQAVGSLREGERK